MTCWGYGTFEARYLHIGEFVVKPGVRHPFRHTHLLGVRIVAQTAHSSLPYSTRNPLSRLRRADLGWSLQWSLDKQTLQRDRQAMYLKAIYNNVKFEHLIL